MRDLKPIAAFAIAAVLMLGWMQQSERHPLADIGIQSAPTAIPLNFDVREFKDLSGPGFRIYRPALQGLQCNTRDANQEIFGNPESWKVMLMSRFEILDAITTGSSKMESAFARSSMAYAEMLKSFVSGAGFGKAEKAVAAGRPPYSLSPFSAKQREGGMNTGSKLPLPLLLLFPSAKPACLFALTHSTPTSSVQARIGPTWA